MGPPASATLSVSWRKWPMDILLRRSASLSSHRDRPPIFSDVHCPTDLPGCLPPGGYRASLRRLQAERHSQHQQVLRRGRESVLHASCDTRRGVLRRRSRRPFCAMLVRSRGYEPTRDFAGNWPPDGSSLRPGPVRRRRGCLRPVHLRLPVRQRLAGDHAFLEGVGTRVAASARQSCARTGVWHSFRVLFSFSLPDALPACATFCGMLVEALSARPSRLADWPESPRGLESSRWAGLRPTPWRPAARWMSWTGPRPMRFPQNLGECLLDGGPGLKRAWAAVGVNATSAATAGSHDSVSSSARYRRRIT